MSTKTLLKRLALGTVVALSASVLTVSSAHASNTSTVAGNIDSTDTLAVVTAGSVGVLGTSADFLTAGSVAKTATLLSTGNLTLLNGNISGYFTVSAGAAITSATTLTNISAGQSAYTAAAGDTFTVTPTGAAGSTFQITGLTSVSGTIASVITVTIAGASVYGVPSAAKSYVSWIAGVGSTPNVPTTADAAGSSTTVSGTGLYLEINLNDAYGNPVTTAGALTVTATPGANVTTGGGSQNPSLPTTGTYTTAVFATAPASTSYGVEAKITEATAGAGWSGTVTVAYNGITIATKSGTIAGLVSKITVTPNIVVGLNAADDVAALSYNAYDASGNAVALTSTELKINTNSNTAAIVGLGSVSNANARSSTTTASGHLPLQGGTTAGTAAITLKYTRTDGVVVTSNSFNVSAGDAAYSYTAMLDKSSYNQGDVATLTVKFLDSKGNPAASDSSLYTVATTGNSPYSWDATLVTPMMTSVGTIGSYAASTNTIDSLYPTTEAQYTPYSGFIPDTAGTVTFKYTVGSSGTFAAGNYNAVVSFPTLSHGASQTVAYSVGSQGTSLNDVLKGIVALIASINKQIAALAKLVAPAKKK
jgi:hypothetical protein